MKPMHRIFLLGFFVLMDGTGMIQAADRPLVIAHRGASGYLPEHTLAAKAAAFAMGADYIEQDVVLTKDGVPVVLHDIHLDTVTNVAKIFPGRARDDDRFYVVDFTLAEIKRLSVHERTHHKTGRPVFPGRFPNGKASFAVPTLAEEIELIQGMNRATKQNVGIYPELKQPKFHHDAGLDLAAAVLKVLERYGYTDKSAKCFLQCFDADEVRRLRLELKCRLPLVQLVGSGSVSPEQIREFAKVADAIGPVMSQVLDFSESPPRIKDFVKHARSAGLEIHAWTLRADQLPTNVRDFASLHILLREARIDGAFSDFPDQSLKLWSR